MSEYKLIIEGQIVSKANSRRLVPRGNGRFGNIKSVKAMKLEADALTQLKNQWGRKSPLPWDGTKKKGWLGVEFIIYYPSNQQDIDPSLVMDILQKAGVYTNDRQVREYFARKEFDKDRPRAEITIYQLDE